MQQGVGVMQKTVQSQMESGMACLCDYFTRMQAPQSAPIGAIFGPGRMDHHLQHMLPQHMPMQHMQQMQHPHYPQEEYYDSPYLEPLQSIQGVDPSRGGQGRMTSSTGSHVSADDTAGTLQGLRLSGNRGKREKNRIYLLFEG